MPIIKCKICGGDIELSADKTFGTCEYCGTKQTLPTNNALPRSIAVTLFTKKTDNTKAC